MLRTEGMSILARLVPLFAAVALVPAAGCAVSGASGAGAAATSPPPRASAAGSVSVDAEVRVDFFGVPLAGAQDVVFVLDRSGSMSSKAMGRLAGTAAKASHDAGGKRWETALVGVGAGVASRAAGVRDESAEVSKIEAAKRELLAAVEGLPDGTRIGIVFFNRDIHAMSRRLVTLDPNTRRDVASFIRAVEATGSTAAVPAMRLAYEMGARRVVLLSDGLANSGGDGGDLLREARASARRGVRIDTVGIGHFQDIDVLQTMASDSDGIAVVR